VRRTDGNAALAADLGRAVQALRRGEGLAASCSRSPFFDAEALQWLSLADAAEGASKPSRPCARRQKRLGQGSSVDGPAPDPALSLVAGAFVALFVALFVLPLFERWDLFSNERSGS
jgi:type II secretory pathway component PulF